MNAQNVNQILDALGQRFGATGAHLWQVLIRQVYVEAIRDGLFAVLVWAVTILWVRYVAKRWEEWKKGYSSEGKQVGSVIVIIVLVILLVCSTIGGIISVSQLANPEYGALSKILDAVHGK